MVSFHGVERTEAPSGEFTGLVKTEPELVLLITKNRIIAFDSGEKKSLPLPRSKGMVPCNRPLGFLFPERSIYYMYQ